MQNKRVLRSPLAQTIPLVQANYSCHKISSLDLPINILGLTSNEVRNYTDRNFDRGAGFWKEIYQSVMRSGRISFDGLRISDVARRNWETHFALKLPKIINITEEADTRGEQTQKLVLKASDGLEFECVKIPMANEHNTLCISSQIGCKMGCTFCETGRMGLLRNLSASEIVSQVIVARYLMGWKIKNIVFMGMGEALDNADEVIQALRVLNDIQGLNIGQQRMTVCTVGHKAGLAKLAKLSWPRLNVAVSLNASTDEKRSLIMPVNRKTPIKELVSALKEYHPRPKFAYAVNYCLIPGINNAREDARNTAQVTSSIGRALINLIPYNPGTLPISRAPTANEMDQFIAWLEEDGAIVRRRKTKGRSVMAACGQLGNHELRQQLLHIKDKETRQSS